MHGMWRDLNEVLSRRTGHCSAGVDWEDDLGHEDIPRLVVVAARVDVLVGAVPDGIRAPGTAGLDPREDVDRVAGPRRGITHLDRRAPAAPSAGRARRADEDLALAWGVAADAPDHDEVACAVHRQHREEGVG